MIIIRHLRRSFIRMLSDIEAGDFVRVKGKRGVGVVESVKLGIRIGNQQPTKWAVVAWNKDRRDILPLMSLRRVKAGGDDYDRKF